MQRPQSFLRASGLLIFLFLFLLPGLLGGCIGSDNLSFPTEYQAVFLDTGQVFFGKVSEVGPGYFSLQDVYFIQRQVEPDKKDARNQLVRLGSEWNAPDFMRINTRHVVFFQPVAPNSRVAQLIREVKAQPAAAAPPAAPEPQAPAAPAQTPPATAPKSGGR